MINSLSSIRHRALAIELCQIIHRTGLTQDSIEALLLAADVLHLVVLAARDQLRAAIQDKIAGTFLYIILYMILVGH